MKRARHKRNVEVTGKLTAAQQDYIEIIYRLSEPKSTKSVRVTDIAAELGTRLPTVTRTVDKLTEMGLLEHIHRQEASLSAEGRKVALDIVHRHDDLVFLFSDILGLPEDQVELDVCQIEHGISARTAQRLHEFIEYVNQMLPNQREIFAHFRRRASFGESDFRNLPERKVSGWRS